MGRRKLEIKLIEHKSARQVTFARRNSGLMKKAKELSILCDADVAVIIYSCRQKLYQYCSSNSLTGILQRYGNRDAPESSTLNGVSEAEEQCSNDPGYITCGELLQTVESTENEEVFFDNLSVTDTVVLENQLQAALQQIKATKMDLLLETVSSLQEKKKMLAEEKRSLMKKLQSGGRKKKMVTDLNIIPEDDDDDEQIFQS